MDSEIDLIEKGKNLLIQENFREAEGAFEKALQLNPDNAQAYFELGKTCYMQQRYAGAVKNLQKAIALNRNYAYAHLLLAKAYKEAGSYQESLEEFSAALELGCENEDTHRELYAIYRALNNFDLAAEELKKAFDNGYGAKLYQSDLQGLYRAQINSIQAYNFGGRYAEALQEAEKASRFISKENPMFQNMLQNEVEIAQNKISLSCKIRALTVTLTNKCNLSCIMCKSISKPWDIPGKSIEEIIALFPYLERIMWQGGEIFLYKGFKDILKEASKFPMRQIIATNGLLIDREIARILVKSNVELTFSIDGVTKEVYEHIRVGASFEKLIDNLNLINELRRELNPAMKLRLNVLVMRSNYHQIERFLDFAKQYQFNTVFFNSTGEDFKNLKENIFCYSDDRQPLGFIDEVKIKIAKKAEEYKICLENWLPPQGFSGQQQTQDKDGDPGKDKNNKLFCHIPWQRLYIDCGGNVRPDCLCRFDNYVGNILENSLEELWNCEKMQEYRRKIVNCAYQDFCSPDCVYARVPEKNLKFV